MRRVDQGKEEARTLRVQPGIGTGGSSSAGTTQARFIRLYPGHLSRRSEIQLWQAHPRIKSLVKRCAAVAAPRSVFAQGVTVLWSADMELVAGGSRASNLESVVNNYSNGLSPNPATIYVHDAKICQAGIARSEVWTNEEAINYYRGGVECGPPDRKLDSSSGGKRRPVGRG